MGLTWVFWWVLLPAKLLVTWAPVSGMMRSYYRRPKEIDVGQHTLALAFAMVLIWLAVWNGWPL